MSNGSKNNRVVVVSDKKRVSLPPRIKKLLSKLNPRVLKVLVVAVVLLIVAAGYQLISYNRISDNNQCIGKEDSPIYKDAAKVINPGARAQLGKVVDRMKGMKRFDTDPTCLYVATEYFIRISDHSSARDTLSKLQKVYNKDKPNILPIGPEQIKSLDQMNFEITQLENQQDKLLEDARRFNEGVNED